MSIEQTMIMDVKEVNVLIKMLMLNFKITKMLSSKSIRVMKWIKFKAKFIIRMGPIELIKFICLGKKYILQHGYSRLSCFPKSTL